MLYHNIGIFHGLDGGVGVCREDLTIISFVEDETKETVLVVACFYNILSTTCNGK